MLCLLLLGLGALAIGTDAYLTAGLLPAIGRDLHGSLAATAQLVTVFTLSYALLAPVAGAALSRWNVRRVLLVALGVFTVANAVGALAGSTAVLMAARVAAGLGAGIFMPVAATAAAALVGPERRAAALAVVLGGLSSGTVLGVPLGLLLAGQAGWRAAFWLVTVLGAAGWAGLAARLPQVPGAAMPGLRQRIARLRDGRVTAVVGVTFLQTMASLGLYTFVVPVLLAVGQHSASLGLWVWGLGGVFGSVGIGRVVDRADRPRALTTALLALLVLSMVLLPVSGAASCLPLLAVWGAAGWAFVVPQQHRLLGLGPTAGAAALALNSSATYLGAAAGAALGGVVLGTGLAPRALPLCAAACAAAALLIHLAGALRQPVHVPAPPAGAAVSGGSHEVRS